MARINTNVPSLIAQANLAKANSGLEQRLERLATGLRITRGADDPAGLIVSERLRSEIRGIDQGIRNSERASSVIATSEGALAEVSELLNSVKALTVEAANTGAISPEEVAANQLQIDSAIESITRIANTTRFAGLRLLDGSLGYSLSGVATGDILQAKVFSAQFGNRSTFDVDVQTIGSAQTANLFLRADFSATVGGGAVDGQLPSSTTLEIAGPEGVVELTFPSGTTIQDIRDAVNSRSSVTGVEAALNNGGNVASGLVFSSTDFGSKAFVSVQKIDGGSALDFAKVINDGPGPAAYGTNTTTAERDEGKDVVVLVNGAVATGRGLEVSVRGPELELEAVLTEAFATTISGTSSQFAITGGGAKFQLGPEVTPLQQSNIGIDSIAASRLGGTAIDDGTGNFVVQFLSSLKSGGINDLSSGNFSNASEILESAIDDVSSLRGRLGAFERNVVQTNIRSLQAGLENITASESVIRDADFAAETSALTRSQILTSAGTSVLALANSNAQTALQLLG